MKYILITGAYGGMGKSTARLLAERGFRVFALDRSVGEESENIIPLQADVTDEKSVRAAFERVKEITGTLYAIVHFAGIYMLGSLAETDCALFSRAYSVNLFGAYIVNKTFLPLLSEGSRIVITTSELATLDPLPFTGIYAVTKTALDRYAYSLCMELQLLGISVSVLRAGAVDTGMLPASTAALDAFCENTGLYTCNAERFRKIVGSVEARKIPPEKIAEKILRILGKRKAGFAYCINRNILLLLLDALPVKAQLKIVKMILGRGAK